jgi:HEPN domain-containing protein
MPAQSATSGFLARPYRLVSLLDMLPLKYSDLYAVLGILSVHSRLRSDANIDSDDRQSLASIEAYLADLKLKKSLKLAKRMRAEFEDEARTGREFADRMKVLDESVRFDLDEIIFLYIPEHRADFYNNHKLFGDQVATNFSDANYDIEEAGKSLALDRYTACVMHLMRSLEVALHAVGIMVGLPDTIIEANNSWERLLRKINDQITNNDKSMPAANWLVRGQWTAKRQFLVDVHAHLSSVKNAWRNPSMHLEKKYTEREAERIFRAVKDFMEHLATHLDEKGRFTPT